MEIKLTEKEKREIFEVLENSIKKVDMRHALRLGADKLIEEKFKDMTQKDFEKIIEQQVRYVLTHSTLLSRHLEGEILLRRIIELSKANKLYIITDNDYKTQISCLVREKIDERIKKTTRLDMVEE